MRSAETILSASLILCGAALFLVGVVLLIMQKSVVIDADKREVRVETFSRPFRRTAAVYPFEKIGSVVVYAVKFGVASDRLLYASAIRTSSEELILFNPGIPDANENEKVSQTMAGILGVRLIAGKVQEKSNA